MIFVYDADAEIAPNVPVICARLIVIGAQSVLFNLYLTSQNVASQNNGASNTLFYMRSLNNRQSNIQTKCSNRRPGIFIIYPQRLKIGC